MNKKQLQLENERLYKRLNEVETKLSAFIVSENEHSPNSELSDNEVSERTKKEDRDCSNIDFLSKTAMQFVNFPPNSNIYDFVGEHVREFAGKDCYVAVNSVNKETAYPTIHSVLGLGNFAKLITKVLGRDPVGMEFNVKDPNTHFKDGKLHVYSKGLYGILFKTAAKNICRSIEKLAGIKKIFVIDLVEQDHFFGSVIIFSKEETTELKNKQFIELFIKQVSVFILKKQTEDELQINDEKLNKIISSSPIGICTVDKNGHYISTNSAYEEMLGYTGEELSKLSFFDITHPDYRPKNKKLFQKMFSLEGSDFSMEKKYIRKDGEIIDVSVHANCVKDADGIVRFGTAFVDDITTRKKTEKTLRETNARHSAMIENIGDVIAIMEADGRIKYQSPNIEKWFGWTYKEIINSNGWDYLHPDDVEENKDKFIDILKKENNSTTISFRYKCKNGIYKWVELTAVNRLEDSAINGVLLNYHDISENKMTEERIRKQAIKWQTTFNAMSDSVSIIDMDGNILQYNAATLFMFNVNQESMKEKKCFELVHAIDDFFPDCPFLRMKKSGKPETMIFKNSDRWLEVNVDPIFDSLDEIIGAVHVVSDITERKQVEIELVTSKEKAEESDQLKSAFLANMSHEIRTPMNGILGFSELLKKPDLSGEKQQTYINIIEKSGNRMLNIINNIISISKIESGQMEIYLQESDINEQMEYIYSFFKSETESKKIELSVKTSLPAGEATIITDREKVYSILTNLVKNAIKYSQNGSIELGYSLKNEFLEFYVKDTGIGIPENRQKAIFERFIQADISDHMALQGAGLGLSISRAYVEMLGGKIWMKSKVNHGSTFFFTLPYHRDNKHTDTSEDAALGSENTVYAADLKIMIVEDDDISEELISIMIKDFSRDIIRVKTGKDAVTACRNNADIDLILMDIQLPEMNGKEAIKQIRTFNKDVIIIAQTAYALENDKKTILASGCNDYIAKPINANELGQLIIKYLKK